MAEMRKKNILHACNNSKPHASKLWCTDNEEGRVSKKWKNKREEAHRAVLYKH